MDHIIVLGDMNAAFMQSRLSFLQQCVSCNRYASAYIAVYVMYWLFRPKVDIVTCWRPAFSPASCMTDVLRHDSASVKMAGKGGLKGHRPQAPRLPG